MRRTTRLLDVRVSLGAIVWSRAGGTDPVLKHALVRGALDEIIGTVLALTRILFTCRKKAEGVSVTAETVIAVGLEVLQGA